MLNLLDYRIVVYSPQIYENYKLQSGEGLSVFFVAIWLLGDLCNLTGAIMAGLQATVIILALYVSLDHMSSHLLLKANTSFHSSSTRCAILFYSHKYITTDIEDQVVLN